MSQLIPYLNFDGDCEAAFLFYQSVLGGEIPYIGRFGDMPSDEKEKAEAYDANRIMHMSLVGEAGFTVLGSDIPASFKEQYKMGNNISLSINAESREGAKRIFDGLSAGGQVEIKAQKNPGYKPGFF